MSESALEKSLDQIIGEKNSKLSKNRGSNTRIGKAYRREPTRSERKKGGFKFGGESIPREVSGLAHSRPLLRVKNIHPELSGQDISQLFESVGPVEFVKFDPKREDIAYVCFQENQNRNNSLAISRFDGRKAMNQTLVVENATSLVDRIMPAGNPKKSGPSFNKRKGKPAARNALRRKGRNEPQSIESLDAELSAYMSGSNGSEGQTNSEEQSQKLNSEMSDHQDTTQNKDEPSQNVNNTSEETNGQSKNSLDDTNDDMKLD